MSFIENFAKISKSFLAIPRACDPFFKMFYNKGRKKGKNLAARTTQKFKEQPVGDFNASPVIKQLIASSH